jgi:hypothetical protein
LLGIFLAFDVAWLLGRSVTPDVPMLHRDVSGQSQEQPHDPPVAKACCCGPHRMCGICDHTSILDEVSALKPKHLQRVGPSQSEVTHGNDFP